MFRPKYPNIVKPDYGICGVHIRLLASLAMLPLTVGSAFSIVRWIMTQAYFYIPFDILFIIFIIAVLAADKFERPYLYLPFLTYSIISFCGDIISIGRYIYLLYITELETDYVTVIVESVIGDVYIICTWNIVRKARNYMIAEVVSGNVKQNAAGNGCNRVTDA
uniref:Uncharacterized protein n=1 Tax=Panagrellus redivivus TaxID=6233 RepID=A0A7E4W121_PANRE